MKYCASCGKELSDHAKFCAECGHKCSEDFEERIQPTQTRQELPHVELANAGSAYRQTVPANNAAPKEKVNQANSSLQVEPEHQRKPTTSPKKEKKPISKTKLILFSILGVVLVLVIAAGVLLFRWYTSTEQRVLRALDAGDYDAAVVIMEEDASANESKALADQLKERIANIKTGFEDGTIEYASAMMELETIKKLKVEGISAELNAVQTYINNLNESRTNFATAESFYNTGDYAEAIENYRLVIEDDANYATAVEKLADSANKYRDTILEKAEDYADSELYTDAVALLNEALKIIPNDTKITEQIRIYEKDNVEKLKDDALETASKYAKKGDYLNAFKSLNNIMKSQSTDAEIVSAYNKYCDKYAAQIISEVDLKVSEKDFDGAISSLNAALKNLPNNEALVDKLEEVKVKQPVLLSSLEPINGGWTWNEGSPKDPFNNDYSTAKNYAIIESRGEMEHDFDNHTYYTYAEYRIYGDYSLIDGVIAPYTSTKDGATAYIQIFADDVLVYTSTDIGRKTDAFEFSVDISGAEYIKIYVILENDGSYYWYGEHNFYSSLILSDVQLWK